MKNQKGITLIALIITIIVMLILVGVSVSTAINTGLFKTASGVSQNTQAQRDNELIMSDSKAHINGLGTTDIENYVESLKPIPTTESYVGHYIDIENDGTLDGIIYADLAVGGSGEWGDEIYTYGTVSGVKNYSIVGEEGDKKVLQANGAGAERFYVMELEDRGMYTLYGGIAGKADMNGGLSNMTLKEFGTGQTNTKNLMDSWKSDSEDRKDETWDVWNHVQDEVNEGWFLPSIGEWIVFAGELGDDYLESDEYLTSSQDGGGYNYISIYNQMINWGPLDWQKEVRLSLKY